MSLGKYGVAAVFLTGAMLAGTVGAQSGGAVGHLFRDCPECPELVIVPAGRFMMGSPSGEKGRYDTEGPLHEVTIARPFAVGVYEVTVGEWLVCETAGECDRLDVPTATGGGWTTRHPVVNASWNDAAAYVRWLTKVTGRQYRLLSESEWEYVARAGTSTRYWWGDELTQTGRTTCNGCGHRWIDMAPAVVGSFLENGFGLRDVHGNVMEWVADCWNATYDDAPADGSAWETGDCNKRVLRGGSWVVNPALLRSALRLRAIPRYRNLTTGFRVARDLDGP